MKYTLIAFALTITACNGGGGNNPTPNTTTYYDVQNWQNDTLYGVVLDANNNAIGIDTVFAYKTGTASHIRYNNVQYDLKYYNPVPSSPSGASDQTYRGKILLNNVVKGDLFIAPGKYMHSGQLVSQPQGLSLWDTGSIFKKRIQLSSYVAY